jgi:hypothetical protein
VGLKASFGAEIDVGVTPDVAYRCVADLARHAEWSADPIEITPDGPDRFRSVATSKGKRIEAALSVVERRPPELFAFEVEDATGRWVHRFTFTPSAAGTLVRRAITGSLTVPQLLLFWLVLLPIKKPNARRSLGKLKELLEKGG